MIPANASGGLFCVRVTGVTFIYLHCLKYVVLLRYDLRILSVPIVVPIVAATMRVG